MINNINAVGKTPAFKAVKANKVEMNEKAPTFAEDNGLRLIAKDDNYYYYVQREPRGTDPLDKLRFEIAKAVRLREVFKVKDARWIPDNAVPTVDV